MTSIGLEASRWLAGVCCGEYVAADDDEDDEWNGDGDKPSKAKSKRKAPTKTYGKAKQDDVVQKEAQDDAAKEPTKKTTKRVRKAKQVIVEVDLPPRSRKSTSVSPAKGKRTAKPEAEPALDPLDKPVETNAPELPVPAPAVEPEQPKDSDVDENASRPRKRQRSGIASSQQEPRTSSPKPDDLDAPSKEDPQAARPIAPKRNGEKSAKGSLAPPVPDDEPKDQV